jgi:hypothetical protein
MVKFKEMITVNMEFIVDWVTIGMNSYYEKSDVDLFGYDYEWMLFYE